MSIERKDVETIAHLARLELATEDLPELCHSLANILALVDEMQTVSTEHVSPLAHAFDNSQRLRADQISESDRREELQAIAPSVEKGLYRVPKVIE